MIHFTKSRLFTGVTEVIYGT